MNENGEVRFSRLERAPAFKTVSDAILKDIIGGRCLVRGYAGRYAIPETAGPHLLTMYFATLD
jgi:hypothetical protein